MSEFYYDIPLNLGEVIHKKELPRISLKESISKWIHILVVTRYGECKHDDTFGCQIWEHDFENITNSQKFKEELSKAILNSIAIHEPRLTDIRVDIQIEQVELALQNRRVKIRIGIRIRGNIRKTNESFTHHENFFIGPLSYF
jgi:phage baseplate assembly protein W